MAQTSIKTKVEVHINVLQAKNNSSTINQCNVDTYIRHSDAALWQENNKQDVSNGYIYHIAPI